MFSCAKCTHLSEISSNETAGGKLKALLKCLLYLAASSEFYASCFPPICDVSSDL